MSTLEALRMQEEVIAAPELAPLSPAEQALLDVLTPPEYLNNNWRHRFDQAVNGLVDSQLKPEDREAIRAAADLIGWEWFGKPDEELPQTQALYQTSDDGVHMVFEPGSPLNEINQLNVALYILDQLSDISEERKKFFTSIKEAVPVALAGIIRESPIYALFSAFLIEQPEAKDQPITPSWRRIRESQIEHDIRRRYGVTEGDHVLPRTVADLALRKEIHHLDSETMPRQSTKPQDAYTRLNEWLLEEAQGWLPDSVGASDKVVEIFIPQDDKGISATEITVRTQSGIIHDVDEAAMEWSYEVLQYQAKQTPWGEQDFYGRWLGYDLLRALYIDPERDVKGALEKTVTAQSHFELDNVLYSDNPQSHVLFRLRRPVGTVYAELPKFPEVPNYHFNVRDERIAIHDPESLRDRERCTIGWVSHSDNQPDVTRLITTRNQQTDYPKFPDAYDLAIDFTSEAEFVNDEAGDYHQQEEPHIPGFEVVAREGGRWYFARTENDPYAGADSLLIDREGIARLRTTYGSLGLDSLAAKLAQYDEISAYELGLLVKDNSDYTFDSSLSYGKTKSARPELHELKKYVVNGRMQVQCTGAASFLGLSLESAIPGCRSKQIRGKVLTNQERISAVGHAQTLVAYRGVQFILDSTPPGLAGTANSIGSGNSGQLFNHPRTPISQGTNTAPSTSSRRGKDLETIIDDLPKIAISELISESRVLNAALTRPRLERLLQVALRASSKDELYKKAVALKPADPIRRSLEAAIQQEADPENATHIAQVIDYLEGYLRATPEMRKRIGVPKYDSSLIQVILTSLGNT